MASDCVGVPDVPVHCRYLLFDFWTTDFHSFGDNFVCLGTNTRDYRNCLRINIYGDFMPSANLYIAFGHRC